MFRRFPQVYEQSLKIGDDGTAVSRMEPGGDPCCGATAQRLEKALEIFNRRGSVIAVVIGGNGSQKRLIVSTLTHML